MFSILSALGAGVAVTLLVRIFVHSLWGAIPMGLIAFVAVGIYLFRRTGAQIEPILAQVQKHLQGNRRDMAIKALRDAMSLGKWNPFLPGQLREQIGIIEYASGNLAEAEAELSRSSRFTWMSRAFLGCLYFKKKDAEKMKKAFEEAVKVGEKEGVLYTLYAHCLLSQGKKDEAVAVLERGLQKIPGDHRLETNVELAKEGKKLKTAPYGDAWTRFGLEGPPTPQLPANVPKFMRGYATRPGFRQRPQRKR